MTAAELKHELEAAASALNSARFWFNRDPTRENKLQLQRCQAEWDRVRETEKRTEKR